MSDVAADNLTHDMTPKMCLGKIRGVRRRWAILNRLTGLCLVLAATLGALSLGIVADALTRGGIACRASLLLMVVIVAGWVVWRYVRPAWSVMKRDEAALRLERRYPHLHGRIITAVQLASEADRAEAGCSDALYKAVVATAESESEPLHPADVVPANTYLKRILGSVVVIVLLLVVGWTSPELTDTGLRRLLMPWKAVSWPQRTRIHLIEPDPNEPIYVVHSGTFELRGRIEGVIPSTGTLLIQGPHGTDRARFEIGDDGTFAVRYRPVTCDLMVTIVAGDAQTNTLQVRMVPPPDIVAISTHCLYPDYTHLAPTTQSDGNVQAILGTRVQLTVAANKPIAKAVLQWDDDQMVEMSSDGNTQAETEFTVEASRSYTVHLTDTLGFQNAEPVVYRIEMLDNLYPQIASASPRTDKRVTPWAIVPISVEANDDFGVVQARLNWIAGGDVRQVDIPIDTPGKRIQLQYRWPLETLSLSAGSTITYWVEVRDEGRHSSAADWPTSHRRQLILVDEADLARELSERIEKSLEQLTQIEALQQECADAIERVARSSDSPETVKRVRSERFRQERLGHSVVRLADELANAADDYVVSRIGQAERVEQLQRAADILRRIGGSDMPAVVLALDEAIGEIRGLLAQPEEGTR